MHRQFLEVVRGDSILQAAAEMCPAAISGAIAVVVTGLLISRMSSGSIMTIAMVAFCVGITLVATNPADRTYWAQLFLSPIITSWGMVSRKFSLQSMPRVLEGTD